MLDIKSVYRTKVRLRRLVLSALATAVFVVCSSRAKSQPVQNTSSIEGVVVDADTNQPLADVRVSIALGSQAIFRTVLSRPDGRFSFEDLEPANYRVQPVRSGFVLRRSSRLRSPREPGIAVVVGVGERSRVQLNMAREAIIVGRVLTTPNGQPLPNVTVALHQEVYGDIDRFIGGEAHRRLVQVPGIPEGKTNDKGEYRIAAVPAGDYFVAIRLNLFGGNGYFYQPGYSNESNATPIHIDEGNTLDVGVFVFQMPTKITTNRLHFVEPAAVPPTRSTNYGQGLIGFSRASDLGGAGQVLLRTPPGQYRLLLSWTSSSELYYSLISLTAFDDSDQEISIERGIKVTGNISMRNSDGTRAEVPPGIKCRLLSDSLVADLREPSSTCFQQARVSSGNYWLDLADLPRDSYVVSADTAGDDILGKVFEVTKDTKIDIVIARPGASIRGTVVTGPLNEPLSDAIIALVPDAPMRSANLLYRRAVSDPQGRFLIEGIRPGAYHVFAWPDLQGTRYRNPEFLEHFESKGIGIRPTGSETLSLTIPLEVDGL